MPTIWPGWCLAEAASYCRESVRAVAAQVLEQVLTGRSLSDLMPAALESVVVRDRALLQELCYGTVRWFLRLQGVTRRLLERPLKRRDRVVELLIPVGLYQLLFMRVPAHAAVAETVEAVRVLGRPWAAGLVNGILRRFQREHETLLAEVDNDPELRFAHPRWLTDAVRAAWPEKWQAILDAANAKPPMTLRINRCRIDREAYCKQLQQAGVAATPLAAVASALVLERALEVDALPGFAEGLVSVQDAGAQLAAELLDLKPGQRVLDACAAPGGKSGHILELAPEAELTAVDLDGQRLERVRENLQRLQLKASLYLGDASVPAGEWAAPRYDRILLDVPCSATGVIRRHPDIKLLRRANDIPSLVQRQAQILNNIWPLLKPGGILLYVTCSLLPEENEQQLERFLGQQRDARERPIEAAWGHARTVGRQTLPGEESMDGFYYAVLCKGEA